MHKAGPAAQQAAQQFAHTARIAAELDVKLAVAACTCIMSAVLSCPAGATGEASSLAIPTLADQQSAAASVPD